MTWARSAFWTEEKLAECRRLYVDGGTPARIVAGLIGAKSKNAVIGKAHREGWDIGPGRHGQTAMDAELRRVRQNERARRRRAARPKIVRPPRPEGPPLDPTEFVAVRKGGKLPRMDGNLPADAEPVAFRFRPKGRCTWPIGEVTETATCESLVCGAPTGDREVVYCPVHRRLGTTGQKLKLPRWWDPTVVVRRAA